MSGTGEPARAASGTDFGLDDERLAGHPTVYAEGSLAGKTALISGGAGGLGRATAWLMGRLGARIVLTGRDRAKLAEAAEAMRAKEIDALASTLELPLTRIGSMVVGDAVTVVDAAGRPLQFEGGGFDHFR